MGEAFEIWQREADAANQIAPLAREPAEVAAEPEAETDWTTAPPDAVPPWRQEDRAMVDAARAAAAAAPPEDAAATARDLSRLAALRDGDVLSDAEFVAAARARLSSPG